MRQRFLLPTLPCQPFALEGLDVCWTSTSAGPKARLFSDLLPVVDRPENTSLRMGGVQEGLLEHINNELDRMSCAS
jgi:hypothetical protein